ncbi:MAG: hypothetical protein DDT39_01601 [Firmicutes bacterium]|nr:hypothetical protein [candidate division NPL-UPA2 bacterium]
MTKTFTVSGGFHNAEPITLRAKTRADGAISLSKRQADRIYRHMCGVEGCICARVGRWDLNGVLKSEFQEALEAIPEEKDNSWYTHNPRF